MLARSLIVRCAPCSPLVGSEDPTRYRREHGFSGGTFPEDRRGGGGTSATQELTHFSWRGGENENGSIPLNLAQGVIRLKARRRLPRRVSEGD